MDKILKNILTAMIVVLALGFIGISWESMSAKTHRAELNRYIAGRS